MATLTLQERTKLKQMIILFPYFIEGMEQLLNELAEYFQIQSHSSKSDFLTNSINSLDKFLGEADLSGINNDQRIWFHTRLMILIGEFLIELKGGHWFIQTDKKSDFLLSYVVGDFEDEAPEVIIDPAEIANYLILKQPPRSITQLLKQLNLLKK